MKREDARNSRIAYKYVMDNLMEYEGKNIKRLGDKATQKITDTWYRAQEIWPDIAGINGCSPLASNGKTIDFSRMKDKYSRSVEYIEKWDAIDCSITVQEYLETIGKLKAIKERMVKEDGLSVSDLSLMGIL